MNNPSFNSESSLSSLGNIFNAEDIEINTSMGASVYISPTKGFGKTDKDIVDIPIEKLQPFRNHPFKVIYDKSMDALVSSVRDEGILNPLIVRKQKDGEYEILSGHRRKCAAKEAGLGMVPCIVVDYNDEDALLCVVSSNEHRKKLLPSERAKSIGIRYYIILKRRALEDDKDGGRTRNLIAKEFGVSPAKISQCLNLYNLGDLLMEMVDQKRLNESLAYTLVYQMSNPVRDMIEDILCQNSRVKLEEECLKEILAADKAGTITKDSFAEIVFRHEDMQTRSKEEKVTRRTSSTIHPEIARFFPPNYTGAQIEDAMIWLLNKNKDNLDVYINTIAK